MSHTEIEAPRVDAIASDDLRLVAALRAGDERAFAEAVSRFGGLMLRVASLHVSSRAVAEEVVQEAWLGVIAGIDRFEGRSSFKTWLFRILTNIAKTRGEREARCVPFSSVVSAEMDASDSSVDADRFLPGGERWASYWASTPQRFDDLPETRLLSGETLDVARGAMDLLPPAQRTVITMRDVAGFSSEDVCEALQISEVNQRVLLHRARSKVRRALEQHFQDAVGDAA